MSSIWTKVVYWQISWRRERLTSCCTVTSGLFRVHPGVSQATCFRSIMYHLIFRQQHVDVAIWLISQIRTLNKMSSRGYEYLKNLPFPPPCSPQCGGCSSLVVLKSIWKCSECPVSKLLPSPLTVFHFFMDTTSSGALCLPLELLWKHQPAFYLQPQRHACSLQWEVGA